jgi:predicted O-methyltransferase YrrM
MARRTIQLTDALYEYLLSVSLREPEVLRRLRAETAGMERAECQTAPEQGQFMALLVRLMGAARALEIGVFTGYSSLWVALALPADGEMIACDVNADWTATALRYWKEAGVDGKIDLRLGPAAETLERLAAEGRAGSFDFAFIDADKRGYDSYYEGCLRLMRSGGLIAIDNVLRHGAVADPAVRDAETESVRALNRKIAADRRVDISLVPVADGLTLARKR